MSPVRSVTYVSGCSKLSLGTTEYAKESLCFSQKHSLILGTRKRLCPREVLNFLQTGKSDGISRVQKYTSLEFLLCRFPLLAGEVDLAERTVCAGTEALKF